MEEQLVDEERKTGDKSSVSKEEEQFDYEQYKKIKYVAPFIVLVATLIVCVMDIRNQVGINTALWHLIITVIVFYIIGYLAQKFIYYTITKVTLSKEQPENEEESQEENSQKDN